MTGRQELIAHCLTWEGVYEDYPFRDGDWCVIRHRDRAKHGFAWIFEREGQVWVNVKCDPEWRDAWRSAYDAVRPAYHMNKRCWNSVILDGSIPDGVLTDMLDMSYRLTAAPTGKKHG